MLLLKVYIRELRNNMESPPEEGALKEGRDNTMILSSVIQH